MTDEDYIDTKFTTVRFVEVCRFAKDDAPECVDLAIRSALTLGLIEPGCYRWGPMFGYRLVREV